jgi:hypothetical protein
MLPSGVYYNHKNLLIQELEQMLLKELLKEILQQEINYHSQDMDATI